MLGHLQESLKLQTLKGRRLFSEATSRCKQAGYAQKVNSNSSSHIRGWEAAVNSLKRPVKVQKSFAARWKIPVGSSNPLRVPTHCSERGARKYKLAVSSVSFTRAATMLCFCKDVKGASDCLQTNSMASFGRLA